MAICDADPAFVAEAASHIQQTYATNTSPLSPRWYIYEDGALHPAP
jgi:hypothetical protein